MNNYANTIDGLQVGSEAMFDSINPATGEVLGRVPMSTQAQVAKAIASARAAQPGWAARADGERKALMLRVAQVIRENAAHLSEWVTREQGKPLGGVGPDQVPGSRFELWGCEVWTEVPASLDLPVEVVFEDETRRDEMHRKPLGVIGAIAPWNWPLLIAIWQIIPSIRVGNTVVIKPSEYTSIGTLELVRLIDDVLPPGVVNTISGTGEVGAWLANDPGIDKLMFTGSTATGVKIAEAAARNMIPTTMELGGNDAAIVLPEADPREIAMGLFWGAFLNMGQTCACAKRLYVHSSIHDATVAAMKELAETMPMGNGLDEGTVMGPIQNKMQFDKVAELVESAKHAGANIVCGGRPSNGNGFFYPLTLVTGLKDGDRLVDEEQFGPVLPIIKYDDVEEAIASANRLDAGLGASVWSSDVEKAKQVAGRIEAGTVWINQHGMIHPMVPFGGIKGSGYGVEFGVEGLKSVTRPQVIGIKK